MLKFVTFADGNSMGLERSLFLNKSKTKFFNTHVDINKALMTWY